MSAPCHHGGTATGTDAMPRTLDNLAIALALAAPCTAILATSPEPTSWDLSGEFLSGPINGSPVWRCGWKAAGPTPCRVI